MKVKEICKLIDNRKIDITIRCLGKLNGVEYFVPTALINANEYIMSFKVKEIKPRNGKILIYAIDEAEENDE